MLESEDGVRGADDSLTLCRQADETLAVLGEGYHGGSRASTLGVFDDPSLLSFRDRNAQVHRTLVNTNNGPLNENFMSESR